MDANKPWLSPDWIQQSERMLNSYRDLLGKSLLPNPPSSADEKAEQLFKLNAVVLAHDAQDDPVFCYGNLAALKLWEVDLATLLAMPSRKSAEPVERSDRSEMLKQGLEQGFISDYEGVRVSATGKRFMVRNATIWNVFEAGDRIGQAATFSDWEYL